MLTEKKSQLQETATKPFLQQNSKLAGLTKIPSRASVDFRWYTEQKLTTEKGERLDFISRPYLKEIYDCVNPNIVIKKSAQVGISGFAVNLCLWMPAFRPMTVIYILPTDSDVTDFSQARFNSVAKKSALSIWLNIDNVGLKQIGNSFIYFRGSWTERAPLTIPSDMNIYDEVDKCKQDSIEVYGERLSASAFPKEIWLSTPTYEDFGIDAKWKQSDMREWFVKCQGCSLEQILTLEHIDYALNCYRCQRCSSVLDNRSGSWKAQNPSSSIAGFHPTQLICNWISPRTIIDKQTKLKIKKDFFNFVLGETYNGGTEMVTRQDVLACVVDSLPMKGRTCIGVDWGDTSWYVVRKSKRIVDYGKIEGDTRTHAKQVLKISDKFGKDSVIVADFGYGDTKNKELIDAKQEGLVWMCLYTDEGKNLYPKWNLKENKVLADRTRSLQEQIAEIKNKQVQILRNGLENVLIEHFSNIFEKSETDKHGNRKTFIERKGDDHLVHANNYAMMWERKIESEGEPSIKISEVTDWDDD